MAIALAIAWGACSKGERQVTLRFSFQPGKHLKYEQISKRNYSVIKADSVLAERKMVDTLAISMEFVRVVGDSTYEIMERSSRRRSVPSKEDSTKMETVTLTTETLFHILPNGKVQNFEIVEDELHRSTGYVENFYEQGTPVLPPGEKPVGYSWTQTTKVVLPEETMEASTTYTIKALVRQHGYDCALIEYSGNMVLPVTPNPEDSVQRSGVDLIKTKGLMYFAHTEGRVVEQTENWTIDGTRHEILPDTTCDYKVMQDYYVSYRLVGVKDEQ